MSSDDGAVRAGQQALSAGFHRHDWETRREELRSVFALDAELMAGISGGTEMEALSDVMVEAAVGCVAFPLAIADGFLIDGRETAIPMAVEEPSVVAGASFAARLVHRDGGFTTWASDPVMTAQVFLEGVSEEGELRLAAAEDVVRAALAKELASLERRGGGYRGLRVRRLDGSGIVAVNVLIDVRDAMGANRLNTAAELLRPLLEQRGGGHALMAILSNAAHGRTAGARFRIPVKRLAVRLPAGMDPSEAARRICAAAGVAQLDPERAVTHNKGIMNGIASLALATMNDARAVEAAAHAWAARDGRYRGLSTYAVEDGFLVGRIELPLALATVGGSVDFHPAGRASLRILGDPDSPRLCRIAAALGLAQNLAALLALVTRGIQHGHMRYHAARVAWRAGARGREARQVAEMLSGGARTDVEAARAALARLRESGR